jgi:hypothetical protein
MKIIKKFLVLFVIKVTKHVIHYRYVGISMNPYRIFKCHIKYENCVYVVGLLYLIQYLIHIKNNIAIYENNCFNL